MKNQINLVGFKIPEIVKYLGWIILIFVLWFRGCSDNEKSEPQKIKVEIPEIKKEFEPKKPTSIPSVNIPIFLK